MLGFALLLLAATDPGAPAPPPSAPPAREAIAIESYAGARPDDAQALIGPLFEFLKAKGFEADPAALSARIEDRISQSSESLGAAQVANAVRLVDQGWNEWTQGDFKKSIDHLQEALALFAQRPATVAVEQSLRDSVFKAWVGLALSSNRLRKRDLVQEAVAELIRSFPDQEISRGKYGPEPRKIYQTVKADLEKKGLGTLRVKIDDPAAVVFVNERYVGVGDSVLENLHAGRYRVYVQKGSQRGRVHRADVVPRSEVTVSVTWELDASLRTSPSFVGFEFVDEATRQAHEARHASTLAGLLGAKSVIVLGIRPFDGRPSVVGTVLSPDSNTPMRVGAVATDPTLPGRVELEKLGQFLEGGDLEPPVMVPGQAKPAEAAPVADLTTPAPEPASPVLPWATIGTGGAAAIAGVVLLAMNDPCQVGGVERETCRPTTVPGVVTLAAGAAIAAGGIVWWLVFSD